KLSGLSALPSSEKYSIPKYKTSYSARWIRLSRISSFLFDTSVLSCDGRNSPALRNFSSLASVASSNSIRFCLASRSSHSPFTLAIYLSPSSSPVTSISASCSSNFANSSSKSSLLRPPPPILTSSEEYTSELQSRFDLVCRLLLEKKKTTTGLHRKCQ